MEILGHNFTGGQLALAGVGGVAAVYLAYKVHEQSSAASASSASPSAIDPVTGLPYSEDDQTDPLTGLTYLAEAQQYGSVTAAEQQLAGTGLADEYGYSSDLTGTSTAASLTPSNVVGGTSYATNAAWAQAVEAGLTDIGYSPTDVAAALGRYLGSLSETSAQATIVQAALAEYGPPPSGSYQIIMAPSTTTASSGSSSSSGTAAAAKPAEPGGVSASAVTSSGFTLRWNAVAGATSYPVRVTYQGAAAWTGTASGTSISVTGLTADHTYTVHVAAANSAGTSAETNGPTVHTSK